MSQNVEESITSHDPIFNIGIVSRMTNIQETTLRMWERRYHFPQSTRTAGGHRLYSQQEVLRLQWVKARLDEGMQISQSIRALQRLEQENAIQFNEPLPWDESSQEDQHILMLQDTLFEALIHHDKKRIDETLAKASILFPAETLVLELVRPALEYIGQAWSQGEIGVATEHFASHYLRQYLLNWIRVAPPSYNIPPVIMVCAPGELHEGGLLIFAVLLGRLRWPILYLGQTMPLAELAKMTQNMPHSAVVFSASSQETALALSHWPHFLITEDTKKPIITYGGYAFNAHPHLVEQVPGVFLGPTIPDGVEKLTKILHQLYPRTY